MIAYPQQLSWGALGTSTTPYSVQALGVNLGVPEGTVEDVIVQVRTEGGSGNVKPHLLKGGSEAGTLAEKAIAKTMVFEGSPATWGTTLTPAEAKNLGVRIDFTPSTSPDEITVTEILLIVKVNGVLYGAEIVTPTPTSAGAVTREIVFVRNAAGELSLKAFAW